MVKIKREKYISYHTVITKGMRYSKKKILIKLLQPLLILRFQQNLINHSWFWETTYNHTYKSNNNMEMKKGNNLKNPAKILVVVLFCNRLSPPNPKEQIRWGWVHQIVTRIIRLLRIEAISLNRLNLIIKRKL